MNKTRIIFFAGKGGVGKTTIAAATAIRIASTKRSVLLVSTDPAHSLRDLAEALPGDNPVVLEIDPYQELEQNWGHVRDYLSSLITALGSEDPAISELAMIPGLDNLFGLLRLYDVIRKGSYDTVVVDMAPTGESLRLLGLHQAISLALRITTVLEKYLVTPVIRPASRVSRALRTVVAPAEVAHSWQQLLRNLLDMRRLLSEEAVTSVRLVTLAERMVIAETKRTLTYLNLFGFVVDLVVVNRLFPRSDDSTFWHAWHLTQQENLSDIDTSFAPLPIRKLPLYERELHSHEDLTSVAGSMYADADANDMFYTEPLMKLEKADGKPSLAVRLPFACQDDIELERRGHELFLRSGGYIRSLTLPDSLYGYQASTARYDEGWLRIAFTKDT